MNARPDTSLHENIAVVSAELHTHNLYPEFSDKLGPVLEGFPGVFSLCIDMARVMTEWEDASGAGTAIYDTLERGSWIDVIEEYVGSMLRNMIAAGGRIDERSCFASLPSLRTSELASGERGC